MNTQTKLEKDEIEQALVLIKPDGIHRSLTGNIMAMLSYPNDIIVGAKIVHVTEEIAIEHYRHLKEKPFFNNLIEYFMGKSYANRILALVYEGKGIIGRIRKKAGATNPEEANPISIRGKYGRINSKTRVFENVIHCSENKEEAEREIKLWFKPADLVHLTFPIKKVREDIEVIKWT